MTTHFYQNYLYKTEQCIPHNNMKVKKGGRVTMISWRRHDLQMPYSKLADTYPICLLFLPQKGTKS